MHNFAAASRPNGLATQAETLEREKKARQSRSEIQIWSG